MLILTRRVGEKILIGDNIEIIYVSQARNSARIGITAPHDVNIVREEIVGKPIKKARLPDLEKGNE